MRGKAMTSDLFWDRVDKSGDCWIWKGPLGKFGYGAVGYQYKTWLVHRLSWFFTYGEIPKGLFICHKCDNRACVNPSHLWLGTAKDNSRDMVSKGRSARGERSCAFLYPEKRKYGEDHWSHMHPELTRKGEKHHKAKLSNELVIQVRKRVKAGEKIKAIADELKVHLSSIYLIVNRKTWTHLEE